MGDEYSSEIGYLKLAPSLKFWAQDPSALTARGR